MNAVLTNILIVGAGSCLGGIARYLTGKFVQGFFPATFPWGTLAVNVIGCFVIGLVFGLIDRGCQLSDGARLFATAGFCGGFTTFSTFIHENYLLFNGNHNLSLLLYTLASIAAGFLMVHLAYCLAKAII